MNRLKNWITQHQVTAFFIFTYAITWPLCIVSLFIFPRSMMIQGTLGTFAAFGPVLAGMLITFISGEKEKIRRSSVRPLAFFIAWLMCFTVMTLFATRLRHATIHPGMLIFLGIVCLLPAFVISAAFSRQRSIQQYLKSLVKPRGHFIWYVVALFTFPLLQLLGYFISRLFAWEVADLNRGGHLSSLMIAMGITLFYQLLFAGGINEESGWRGFAVHKLQKKISPLMAAIIVWFFWALWHLFYDISTGDTVSSILFNRLVHNFLWSILFVWIYNRTRSSILAPALFHAAMNTSSEFLPVPDVTLFLFILLTIYAIYADKMWKKTPRPVGTRQ